jgi:hypothetical protein
LKLRIIEPPRQADRARGGLMCPVDVAPADVRARDERQEESLFRTSRLVIKEVRRPREPATGTRVLASRQQVEHQPEGATYGSVDVVPPEGLRMGTRPEVRAGLVLSEHVRGDREPLEVVDAGLGACLVRDRQRRVCLFPVPPR